MRNITESGTAPLFGAASILSFFTPIYMLIAIVAAFTVIDMILTALSAYETKRKRKKVKVADLALKQGLYNIVISTIVIALCWMLGTHVLQMPELNLERIGAGFICVFELLVILKRATFLTKKSVYKHLNVFLKSKMSSVADLSLQTKHIKKN